MRALLICLFFFCSKSLAAHSGQMAPVQGIEIWYETFGNKEDPSLLLIAGGFCQGILWPEEFCEKLAKEGFYVIRYDHRDTGFSTCFEFEKDPYNLLNMAEDAVGLLDYLHIDKAHLYGFSMGGCIAQLVAVHFPERAITLTLMGTTLDLRPSSLAYEGMFTSESVLSKPRKIYLDWMQDFLRSPPHTLEENLERRLQAWAILTGPVAYFEKERYRELHSEFLARLRHPASLTNHLPAMKNSFELVRSAPSQIKVPTLVVQGSEDVIFPPDHGEALQKEIPHCRYLVVEGLGHVLSSQFYDVVIKEIKILSLSR